MSDNLANRVANAVSLKHRKAQLEAAEGSASAASAALPASKVEFFKHDPNRQKAYAEGRKRLTAEDNKRKY